MRLLVCMKTLGDENAALLKQVSEQASHHPHADHATVWQTDDRPPVDSALQVEEGARLRKENEQLKREMQDFKDAYSSKVRRCRAKSALLCCPGIEWHTT
jgi:cell division protein FtsB